MISMNKHVVLQAVPDSFGYWKVVGPDGIAVMTALSEAHAKRWAESTQEKAALAAQVG